MERTGHKNKSFFVGPEVEHTPAFSKRTLFVIGKQDVEKIIELARENKTPHVFMGANHSFEVDPTDGTMYWDQTITALLDRGFWVTLDYPAHQHRSVLLMLNPEVWHSRLFVPLLRVEIPNVQTSSSNLTVKIDDVGFNATNPGVWCMNFNEVTDSNRFTGWIEYESDVIVGDTEKEEIVVELGAVDNSVLIAKKEEPVEPVVTTEMNPHELGLDAVATTALKPEETVTDPVVVTPVDAAEAYATGATEDPLGADGTTKKVATKKVKAT